jgi:hypothetical protein
MGMTYLGPVRAGGIDTDRYVCPEDAPRNNFGEHVFEFLKEQKSYQRYTVSIFTRPREQSVTVDNRVQRRIALECLGSQSMGCYSPLSKMASRIVRGFKLPGGPITSSFVVFHRLKKNVDSNYDAGTRQLEIFYDYVMSFDNQYRRWNLEVQDMLKLTNEQSKELFLHTGLIIPGKSFWNMPKNYLYGMSIVYRNIWDTDLKEFKITRMHQLYAALRAEKTGIFAEYPWERNTYVTGIRGVAGQHTGINIQQPFHVFHKFLETNKPYEIDLNNANWGSWGAGTEWTNASHDVFKMFGPFNSTHTGNQHQTFMRQFHDKIGWDIDEFNKELRAIQDNHTGNHSHDVADLHISKEEKKVRQKLFKLWSTKKGDRACVD